MKKQLTALMSTLMLTTATLGVVACMSSNVSAMDKEEHKSFLGSTLNTTVMNEEEKEELDISHLDLKQLMYHGDNVDYGNGIKATRLNDPNDHFFWINTKYLNSLHVKTIENANRNLSTGLRDCLTQYESVLEDWEKVFSTFIENEEKNNELPLLINVIDEEQTIESTVYDINEENRSLFRAKKNVQTLNKRMDDTKKLIQRINRIEDPKNYYLALPPVNSKEIVDYYRKNSIYIKFLLGKGIDQSLGEQVFTLEHLLYHDFASLGNSVEGFTKQENISVIPGFSVLRLHVCNLEYFLTKKEDEQAIKNFKEYQSLIEDWSNELNNYSGQDGIFFNRCPTELHKVLFEIFYEGLKKLEQWKPCDLGFEQVISKQIKRANSLLEEMITAQEKKDIEYWQERIKQVLTKKEPETPHKTAQRLEQEKNEQLGKKQEALFYSMFGKKNEKRKR